MRHIAYGLTIQSDLELPELPFNPQGETPGPADVLIRWAAGACADEPAEGPQLGDHLWGHRDRLQLQIPHVARFLIQGGRTIDVTPEPGIDQDSLRLFLLGSALGALLFQRGYLVLHGNAIRVGDACMVCVGRSGAGKSTLAAGFLKRGFNILADDVVPVDSDCQAMPGFPRIKLWQDAADHLGINTHGLRRIRPGFEKFNYPLGAQFADKGLPIRWVYVLDNHSGADVRFEPIHGMQRFQPLHDNTYRLNFLQGMQLQPEHLRLCGRLAGGIHLAHVKRPQTGFKLDALIDHLLADMAAHPGSSPSPNP